MGKIPQGILGGVSGAVGGVVGSSWKGINVIKTKPLSVANPQTAGQVAQRTKFSNSVSFAGIILATIIKPMWDRFASRMSGYNEFIKTNIDLFAATLPSTPSSLVISKGKMAKTDIATIVATHLSASVDVTWVDDQGEGFKLATDEAFILIYNSDSGTIDGFNTTVDRSTETATVVLSDVVGTGEHLECYLAFRRADGTIVSNTDHLQDIV